jgi:hypothetical protein
MANDSFVWIVEPKGERRSSCEHPSATEGGLEAARQKSLMAGVAWFAFFDEGACSFFLIFGAEGHHFVGQ